MRCNSELSNLATCMQYGVSCLWPQRGVTSVRSVYEFFFAVKVRIFVEIRPCSLILGVTSSKAFLSLICRRRIHTAEFLIAFKKAGPQTIKNKNEIFL
jgi:hypothetical protein